MNAVGISQLLATTVRMTTPLVLAATGGAFSHQSGVWNIGLEGMMLSASFASVGCSYLTADPWVGVAAGVITGASLGFVMALFVLRFRANEIIAGLALNMLCEGLTAYLMMTFFGTRGSFVSARIVGLPTVQLPIIKEVPFIGGVLSGHSPLVYLSWVLLAVASYMFYHTHFGLNLRAVGEHPEAANAAGISVVRTRYTALILAGVFCGLAGAQLGLGFLCMFAEGMTSGRGLIAFTAVIFGRAVPCLVGAASLLFGFAEALGIVLQGLNMPTQFSMMVPYMLTIVILVLAVRRRPSYVLSQN